MGRFLTSTDLVSQFGEREMTQIAGTGDFNSLEGSVVDVATVEAEIAFVDELIAGYVLARHPWIGTQAVEDMPNLLKGLGGDIVRYRLRDKNSGKGQVSETVEKRHDQALKRLEAIQQGKLDLPRDRLDGADLTPADLPGSDVEGARISGPAPRASEILEGY